MKNQLKLMVSKKVADQSHFGLNILSLFYQELAEFDSSWRRQSEHQYNIYGVIELVLVIGGGAPRLIY